MHTAFPIWKWPANSRNHFKLVFFSGKFLCKSIINHSITKCMCDNVIWYSTVCILCKILGIMCTHISNRKGCRMLHSENDGGISVWRFLANYQCYVDHILLYFLSCYLNYVTFICTPWKDKLGLSYISSCTWAIDRYSTPSSYWDLSYPKISQFYSTSDITISIFTMSFTFTFFAVYFLSLYSSVSFFLFSSIKNVLFFDFYPPFNQCHSDLWWRLSVCPSVSFDKCRRRDLYPSASPVFV